MAPPARTPAGETPSAYRSPLPSVHAPLPVRLPSGRPGPDDREPRSPALGPGDPAARAHRATRERASSDAPVCPADGGVARGVDRDGRRIGDGGRQWLGSSPAYRPAPDRRRAAWACRWRRRASTPRPCRRRGSGRGTAPRSSVDVGRAQPCLGADRGCSCGLGPHDGLGRAVLVGRPHPVATPAGPTSTCGSRSVQLSLSETRRAATQAPPGGCMVIWTLGASTARDPHDRPVPSGPIAPGVAGRDTGHAGGNRGRPRGRARRTPRHLHLTPGDPGCRGVAGGIGGEGDAAARGGQRAGRRETAGQRGHGHEQRRRQEGAGRDGAGEPGTGEVVTVSPRGQ